MSLVIASVWYGAVLGPAGLQSMTIAPLAPVPILLGWAWSRSRCCCSGCSPIWRQRAGREPWRIATLRRVLPAVLPLVIAVLSTRSSSSSRRARFSLLELDLRTLATSFTNVLPIRGAILLSTLLLAIHLLPFPIVRLARPVRLPRFALALAAAWLVLALVLARSPRVPSPLADMSADLWEQFTMPEVVVDRRRPARYAPALLDKSESELPDGAPAYDKVLVFVRDSTAHSSSS